MSAIAAPALKNELYYQDGTTEDIIKVILEVERDHHHETTALAASFTPDRAGMERLFWHVKNGIPYQEDPAFKQWIQTPARLWHNRKKSLGGTGAGGDCKSMTLFICSVLKNMGLPYRIRFVSYSARSKRPTHVYPIVVLNGRDVILDAVYHGFNMEKPWKHKQDYNFTKMAEIYKLSGIGSRQPGRIGELQDYKKRLDAIIQSIPDEVVTAGPGDLTKLSASAFERLQVSNLWAIRAEAETNAARKQELMAAAKAVRKGTIAGIGSTNPKTIKDVEQVLTTTQLKQGPAFRMPSLQVDGDVQSSLSGFFQDIGDAIKKAFTKLVNWVFKGPAREMGAYFLYKFLPQGKKLSAEITKRIGAQSKTLDFFKKVAKFDESQLMREFAAGIAKKTGKTPTEFINSVAGKKIAGIGFTGAPATNAGATNAKVGFTGVEIVAAIQIIMQIIGKIADLFKKKKSDAGEVTPANASDPAELAKMVQEEEAKAKAESGATQTKPGEGKTPKESGGSGGMIGLGLAALVGIVVLSRN